MYCSQHCKNVNFLVFPSKRFPSAFLFLRSRLISRSNPYYCASVGPMRVLLLLLNEALNTLIIILGHSFFSYYEPRKYFYLFLFLKKLKFTSNSTETCQRRIIIMYGKKKNTFVWFRIVCEHQSFPVLYFFIFTLLTDILYLIR